MLKNLFGGLLTKSQIKKREKEWKEKINTFIPSGEIPPVRYDTKEINRLKRFLELYNVNSMGYRCPEFNEIGEFNIITVGCSFVFGTGIEQDELFSEVFCNKISSYKGIKVINWNLGIPGSSNDYIARILTLAMPILKPDLVLINFTCMNRRELVDYHGKLIRYINPNLAKDTGHPFQLTQIDLTSEYDDIKNSYMNYKHIENLLSSTSTDWLWSCIDEKFNEILFDHIDQSKYCGCFYNDFKSKGRDHPGKKANFELFKKYWAKFNDAST